MPSYVLKCEGCAKYGSFLIHEGELTEASQNKPIERFCPTCHKTTAWTVTISERRGGHDRRSGLDRRTKEREGTH